MNERFGGGYRKVGYMKRRTKVLSIALVRTGVMEIGQKSACCVGQIFWGWDGCSLVSTDVALERLKR